VIDPKAEMDRLTGAAHAARVPLYAMVELTWRCNFRCVHCYQEGLRDRHVELSTPEWKTLLDELAELGCVFLTLTGGETLARKDFAEIYRHAVTRGFMVTVFTNGSLVSEDILKLWAKLPPRKLEITLYGMSREKYAEVNGQPDGFTAAFEAIDRLGAMGIRVDLKAPAMRPLLSDLPAMAAFAAERGLSFRSDAGLFPRLDGNRAPLAYRLSAEESAAIARKTPGLLEAIDSCFAGVPNLSENVYQCGAASNALNVNPSGFFEACAISRGTSLDWRKLGAKAAWAGLAVEATRKHASSGLVTLGAPGTVDSCGSCRVRGTCGRCPGKSWMESGHVEKPVPHYCDVSGLLAGERPAASMPVSDVRSPTASAEAPAVPAAGGD
jgi:radical SAM protein with 4Fe4S-binding SPASM domain